MDNNLMVEIITEIWRLKKNINNEVQQKAALEYSFRKLEKALKGLGYSYFDLTDEKYDEGLSAKVVYKDNIISESEVIVVETVLPIIFYNNKVIRNAEIIIGNKKGVK